MAQREKTATVQLKVRMRESLRAVLAEAAESAGHSLNAEIVARLERSFANDDTRALKESVGEHFARVMAEIAKVQENLPKFTREDYERLNERLKETYGEPSPSIRKAGGENNG